MITNFELIRIGRVCQESVDLSVQLSMSCLWIDMFSMIFKNFCYVVRSLFYVSTMSNVAVELLVEKCFVYMSAIALCSGRESPFLEVRFDRRLPWREAGHPSPYCPIPCCGCAALGLAKNSSA